MRTDHRQPGELHAIFDKKQGLLTGAEIRAQNMLKVLRNDIVQGMPKNEPASEAGRTATDSQKSV